MGTPTTASDPSAVSLSATATCTTAVPDKYGYVPFDACNSQYPFYPSFAGNIAFAAAFGLSLSVHIIEAIVFRKRFCWVLIMGAAWETAAFVMRSLGAHNQQNGQFALWGQLFFLLAPLWVNAFAYMTVARMIYFALPEKKMWGIRPMRLTVLFVWLDVICFLVQAGGGGMLGNTDAKMVAIGQKLYMAGIGVQMCFVIIFGAMTVAFYLKLRQQPANEVKRVKYLTFTTLALLVLILIRIVFRLVEFGPGVNDKNPIITNEHYPFLLDALPMVVGMLLLNVVHPGMVLRGPDSDFPRMSRAEKKALKQQKKEDKQRQKAAKKAGKNGFDQVPLVDYDRLDSEREGSNDQRRHMV